MAGSDGVRDGPVGDLAGGSPADRTGGCTCVGVMTPWRTVSAALVVWTRRPSWAQWDRQAGLGPGRAARRGRRPAGRFAPAGGEAGFNTSPDRLVGATAWQVRELSAVERPRWGVVGVAAGPLLFRLVCGQRSRSHRTASIPTASARRPPWAAARRRRPELDRRCRRRRPAALSWVAGQALARLDRLSMNPSRHRRLRERRTPGRRHTGGTAKEWRKGGEQSHTGLIVLLPEKRVHS
jgi:hypothetical protein